MAFPLVPFVAGAVIGGLGTYFYCDERLRSAASRTARELSGKAKRTAEGVSDTVSGGFRGLREKVAEQPEESPAAKRRPANKAARKSPAAKKTTRRKAAPAKKAARKSAKSTD